MVLVIEIGGWFFWLLILVAFFIGVGLGASIILTDARLFSDWRESNKKSRLKPDAGSFIKATRAKRLGGKNVQKGTMGIRGILRALLSRKKKTSSLEETEV